VRRAGAGRQPPPPCRQRRGPPQRPAAGASASRPRPRCLPPGADSPAPAAPRPSRPRRSLSFSLTELTLGNNTGLIGPLPNQASALKYFRRLSAPNTDLSCVPGDLAVAAGEVAAAARARGALGEVEGMYPRCEPDALLPCFLTFADYDAPRSDFSNMRCYPLQRKSNAEAAHDCPGGGASQLDDAADPGTQLWELSPSYYQFQNCRCLPGFNERWSRNRTLLTCEPIPKSAVLPAWMWVLVALGVVLALLAGAIALLGSRWVLFRSRWAREMELKRKRARGPPKSGGPVSIVVTDIEGYSGALGCWLALRGAGRGRSAGKGGRMSRLATRGASPEAFKLSCRRPTPD
jgi:hypothetical protein